MNKMMVTIIFLTSLFIAPLAQANCGNGPSGAGEGCESGDGSGGSVGPQGPAGTNGINGVNGATGQTGIDANTRHFLGEVDVRLLDGKRNSLYLFNAYGFDDSPNHDLVLDGRNAAYGFKWVIKLGSSYEERKLAEQQKEIDALRAALLKR